MTVPGAHACRAAADDLNTALGGDLKLTTFGPRLPELSREVELGDFFGRRVFGEPLLMGAFRGDAPGEDGSMSGKAKGRVIIGARSLDYDRTSTIIGCRPIEGSKRGERALRPCRVRP